mmetsp:Transcript_58203/g.104532  ORF Transcript_58203/g.104532 Transcript_58203/m.104532 type:complete len:204 (-) Transcript_58203:1418-2029(-)
MVPAARGCLSGESRRTQGRSLPWRLAVLGVVKQRCPRLERKNEIQQESQPRKRDSLREAGTRRLLRRWIWRESRPRKKKHFQLLQTRWWRRFSRASSKPWRDFTTTRASLPQSCAGFRPSSIALPVVGKMWPRSGFTRPWFSWASSWRRRRASIFSQRRRQSTNGWISPISSTLSTASWQLSDPGFRKNSRSGSRRARSRRML